MKIIKTEIEEVVILEPQLFNDERGYFYESFSEREFSEKICKCHFIQDNQSKSCYGVLRGLHYQKAPHAQSKLVRCINGKIYDVAVDIRKGSPTYGKYVGLELSQHNHRQLFIPRGFAHGFVVLSDEAIVEYKCDNYYSKESEGAILWDDPNLGINWGVDRNEAILSEKDKLSTPFKDFESPFSYDINYYE